MNGFLLRSAVLLPAVALWEATTRFTDSPFFPPPSAIAAAAARIWFTGPPSRAFLADTVFTDVLPGLGRVLGGWLLAAVLGTALGIALGRSRTGMDYAGPLFAFARAVPPPTLIPVFLVVFGIGATMQVATIVFGALWPVLLNSVDGARSLDPVQEETARSLRTPPLHRIVLVVLPAALPKVFAGLRLSLAIAVILMVVSELVGAANGIGYQLLFAQRQFDFPVMCAWIALLGLLGYGLNTVLLAVEHRVLRWQPTRERTARAAA